MPLLNNFHLVQAKQRTILWQPFIGASPVIVLYTPFSLKSLGLGPPCMFLVQDLPRFVRTERLFLRA